MSDACASHGQGGNPESQGSKPGTGSCISRWKTLWLEVQEHPSAFLSILSNTAFMHLPLPKGEEEVFHGKHGVKHRLQVPGRAQSKPDC